MSLVSKTTIKIAAIQLVALVFGIWTVGQERLDDGILVPAFEDGKWGYIDRAGFWKIPPQFEAAVLFSDGLAAVRKAGRWGFIGSQGDERVAPQFSAVGNFKSGRAPVRLERKWGYIDETGKWIISPTFQSASEFHDGVARVEFWDSVCGWNNEEAPEKYFDRKFTESYNLPGARCGAVNSRIGYVNRDGLLVIVPQYADGSDFSEGLAAVMRKDGVKGYIDKTGNVVLPFQYAVAEPFSEGLASVVLLSDNERKDRAIVIDKNGKPVFQRRFPVAPRSFSEGLAPFAITNPDLGWGYIDRTGATAFVRTFTQAFPFSEGLAVVWLRDKFHQEYIDKTGRVVFRLPYGAEAEPIRNGIAVIHLQDGHLQYFDKTGKQIVARSVSRLE